VCDWTTKLFFFLIQNIDESCSVVAGYAWWGDIESLIFLLFFVSIINDEEAR